MPIAVSHILANIKHELGGGSLPIELNQFGIINQAGHHLYSMHPWSWTQERAALMDLRGIVTGETATWTASSSTLTQASGFTTYSFLVGDEVRIIEGTGATEGVYKIASRTSANAIVLDGSIAAGNLATGDIEWRIEPSTIELPEDLRDIIAISSTSISSLGGVTLTTLQRVLDLRTSSLSVTAGSGLYYGAVTYAGSPPVPILEIYPTPGANVTGAFRIFYRSRWTEVSADSSQIDVPAFVEDLLVFIVRAYAAGYVRNDVASIHARLAEIAAGPIFAAAKRSDGMIQPYHGQLRNGSAMVWRRQSQGSFVCDLLNQVAAPTD